jgi:hypothetical protein
LSAWLEIRRAAFASVCAAVACVCLTATSAQANSNSDTADQPKTSSAANKHKPTAKSTGPTKSTSRTHTASTANRSRKKRVRGQEKIDSERAQAIQEALIREHYLSGEATGVWNQASEQAMRRYQADQGWQSKTVPDSRALIKLGLGPSKDHLLNPESAMTTAPDAPRAETMPTTSHTTIPTADPAQAPSSNLNDSSRPQ